MSLPRLLLVASLLLSFAGHAAEIPLAVPRIAPSVAPHFRYSTAVASSGHGYLVAWEERAMQAYPPGTIMVRAFDERGVPMQPAPTVLAYGVAPSIAWNGSEYLVVFGQLGSRYGIAVSLPVAAMMRIAEDGTAIDQSPVILTKDTNAYTFGTSVAWNGSEYLVSWNGYSSGAALVTPDLQIELLDVSAAGAPVSVASNGGGFLVAGIAATDRQLRLLPISSEGQPGRVQVIGAARNASLTAVDGEYELLWSTADGLQAARVTSYQNPTPLSASSTAFERVVVRNGAVVASWVEYPHAPASNASRICTERLDVASPASCSDESENLHDPSIGVADDTFLLAWSDRSSGIDQVRIDVTGKWTTPLAGGGSTISEAAPAQQQPSIERRADGGIAAVWSEANPVTGRYEIRFGGLDPRGIPIPDRAISPSSRDQYDPQISTANGRSLVTWNDVNSTQSVRIGIVVDDAGNALSALISFEGNAGGGALAFDGAEWLVVWRTGSVRFSIVDRNGSITQTASIDEAFSPVAIAAAGGAGRFVVAWAEGETRSVRAANIVAGHADAAVTVDVTNSDFGLDIVAVAIHGNRTLVSWHAQSNDARPSEVRQALLDEHAARLAPNSALAWRPYVSRLRARSTPAGFALLASPAIILTSLNGAPAGVIDAAANVTITDFLADAADRFTVAYARSVSPDEHLGLTARAFVRTVEPARNRAARMR